MTTEADVDEPDQRLGAAITLPADPSSAGAARRFVIGQIATHDPDLVDMAALLTTELATNAILHAGTEFSVQVGVVGDRVRIELSDHSPVLPVRRRFSEAAGTGRGLQLVEAMALRWGVEAAVTGKTVFVEISPDAVAPRPPIELDLEAWPDLDPPPPGPDLVQVRVLGLPIEVEHRASEYFAELFREFALIAERQPELRAHVPGQLLELIDTLDSRFAGFTAGPRAEIAAAYERGAPSIDLDYWVPAAAGEAAADLNRLLDDADEFCRTGDALLTLAAPGEATTYRRWYCTQFMSQCDGHPATPWDRWQG